MNDDGHGRRVFDGVLTHVAGAGKVFANHSFAMPGRTATQHEDRLYPENWFPFGNAVTTDPFSGERGAILKGRPTDPLMIEVNTATEYWQKGASLVHTDPAGRRDAELPPNARAYMIAGTQHGGGPGTDPEPRPLRQPAQPAQRQPGIAGIAGGARRMGHDRGGAAAEPGPVDRPRHGRRGRAGRDAESAGFRPRRRAPTRSGRRSIGSTRPPGSTISTRPTSARSTPTATRLPASACRRSRCRSAPIPAGTSTAPSPANCPTATARLIPFARTKAEREAAGDPRPSLDERYGGRDAYVARVEAAAEALVADRLLLPADAALYVKAARECDRF